MKVLVTGGSGFIGSNLVQLLLEQGFEITVIDDLSSGYFDNISQWVFAKQIEFIKADIRNENIVIDACKDKEVVFHMAACVGRQKSLDNPALDSTTNLLGTLNVLEGMRKNNVRKIIYSSSAAIFGELITSTINEEHPQNADSPYGVSKLAAEKMILAYSKIYGIEAVCLRYFNIYGTNQRFDLYGNVIPIFAKKIYSNEPIVIYGDGTQTRDFVNVKDVARANLVAALSDEKYNIFNLGSGHSITINHLAERMQEIAGINVGIKYESERLADVKHCKANTSKVEEILGFKTNIPLKEGLEEYMRWYEKTYMGEKK